VRASLGCRLVDPRGELKPSEEKREAGAFKRAQDSSSPVSMMQIDYLEKSGYLRDDSLTVECTLTVLKEIPDVVTSSADEVDDLPSSGLHHHLGELLQSEAGADVTFLVAGQSFAAHKAILAARSPVLMAEFFGEMKEKSSRRVEVKGMEAPAFEAMLHFIYTDAAAELGD
jgi:speckle-type POZ protein